METTTEITQRLEYLRGELRAERISYGELAELQIHGENGDIEPGDIELLEAAGVPEDGGSDSAATTPEPVGERATCAATGCTNPREGCEYCGAHHLRLCGQLHHRLVHTHNKLSPTEKKAHTQGKWVSRNNWVVRPHPTCDIRVAVCDAYTKPKGTSDPRDRANAKFIAAAPEMYAALDVAQARLDDMPKYLRNNGSETLGNMVAEILKDIREALTAADGFEWQDRTEVQRLSITPLLEEPTKP